MRFHRLKLTGSADRTAYWGWLIRNPVEFQKFVESTRYFEFSPPIREQAWCCRDRRRPATPDPGDEQSDLEVVMPLAYAPRTE